VSVRFGLVLTAALLVGGTARAGDTPPATIKAPPPNTSPSWTGLYLGIGIGGGTGTTQTSTSFAGGATTSGTTGSQGFLGSIYGGLDYQFAPRGVAGLMVDGTWSSIESTATATFGAANATATTRSDLSWSVLARLGFLSSPSTLWYALGGYTGQNRRTTGTATIGGTTNSFSRNDTVNGWTLGPGVETMLPGGWSARFEYRFTQFGGKSLIPGSLDIVPALHTIRAGLSYKFGGPALGAAPMAPFAEPPTPRWTGAYLGAAAGVGVAATRARAAAGGASATMYGIGGVSALGSVFGGFDYQIDPRWVVGLMADGTWSGADATTSATIGGANATTSLRGDGSWSVLGRAGWLSTPSTLWYVLGGYTGQTFHSTVTATAGGAFASASSDNTLAGWTIGPGVESVISGPWSTRLEYRFTQFGEMSSLGGAAGLRPATHTARIGLSYKFGVGASSSVAGD
jgi:outer membrane immunogenic protein